MTSESLLAHLPFAWNPEVVRANSNASDCCQPNNGGSRPLSAETFPAFTIRLVIAAVKLQQIPSADC
jgi:hypothetical protein